MRQFTFWPSRDVHQTNRQAYRPQPQACARRPARGQRSDVFRVRQSSLESWLPWLDSRWEQGARNALALWREMRGKGFRGQSGVVSQWAQRRRLTEKANQSGIARTPSARSIVRLMTFQFRGLSDSHQRMLRPVQRDIRRQGLACPLGRGHGIPAGQHHRRDRSGFRRRLSRRFLGQPGSERADASLTSIAFNSAMRSSSTSTGTTKHRVAATMPERRIGAARHCVKAVINPLVTQMPAC